MSHLEWNSEITLRHPPIAYRRIVWPQKNKHLPHNCEAFCFLASKVVKKVEF